MQVCAAYEVDGDRTERFLPDSAMLERVRPVYEHADTWSEDVSGARTLSDLPSQARAYLERIESAVGVPIEIVSVGPDREQTIRL